MSQPTDLEECPGNGLWSTVLAKQLINLAVEPFASKTSRSGLLGYNSSMDSSAIPFPRIINTQPVQPVQPVKSVKHVHRVHRHDADDSTKNTRSKDSATFSSEALARLEAEQSQGVGGSGSGTGGT